MTYTISDIHGCHDKYRELLKKINFGPKDTLYVLGDVIDRGPAGFKILLDMADRPNIVNLLGNHEAMAIDALPGILRCIGEDGEALAEDEAEAADLWFYNGGELSLADLLWLNEDETQRVIDYMNSMPLYKEVEVGEQKFILVHGGLEDFSASRPLTDYAPEEILWCRPESDTVYYPDNYVIYGHTPVQLLCDGSGNKDSTPKIFHNEKAIDIDCGCVFPGGKLGCLCLDTMEEFYV